MKKLLIVVFLATFSSWGQECSFELYGELADVDSAECILYEWNEENEQWWFIGSMMSYGTFAADMECNYSYLAVFKANGKEKKLVIDAFHLEGFDEYKVVLHFDWPNSSARILYDFEEEKYVSYILKN